MDEHSIDYQKLVADIASSVCKDPWRELVKVFEAEWLHFYKLMTPRATNICGQVVGQFEYAYDHYTYREDTGVVVYSDMIESRLVYVHGRSEATTTKRNSSRQKGWVGPTERFLGTKTDKGHFIAHSIGGGLEINVFAQDRATNRGWSEKGKLYRKMEAYCRDHAGTYCFSRPIYRDLTSRPIAFDFGILVSLEDLWWKDLRTELTEISRTGSFHSLRRLLPKPVKGFIARAATGCSKVFRSDSLAWPDSVDEESLVV